MLKFFTEKKIFCYKNFTWFFSWTSWLPGTGRTYLPVDFSCKRHNVHIPLLCLEEHLHLQFIKTKQKIENFIYFYNFNFEELRFNENPLLTSCCN